MIDSVPQPTLEAAPAPLPALIDRFGRRHTYLRVSVTERCNLRCTYCMPAEGVALRPREEILTFEEIERIVALLARMGVSKVRLTGGEPLVRHNLERLIEKIAAIDGIRTVAMTTNGVRLGEKAALLRRAGLTQLNVSLDTLRRARFERIALRDEFERTWAGIEAALAAGFAPLKLNMVVMRGVNDDELVDFVELARSRPINVRFIEYMPFAGNGWERARVVGYREMLGAIRERCELVACPTDDPSFVAREFEAPGFVGSLSFITSMTDDFCAGCSRLRLLADGGIKSCLFSPPEDNLRAAMRGGADDADIERIIRRVIGLKQEKHAGMDHLAALPNNSMIQIGG
jgi:cyclic pyranopterin phosphate synthase